MPEEPINPPTDPTPASSVPRTMAASDSPLGPMPSLIPAPKVPDHELLSRIARGSYGEVWLARNIMGTYRAVKLVYRAAFDSPRPFDREFNGIQKFEPISRSHSGLVDVLQMGRTDEYFYYVMELADDAATGQQIDPERYEAKTLRSEMKRKGRLSFDQCLELGMALCSGLSHMHKHGLIHRDIKPSNIIFVNGQAKLADIGLVAEQSDARSFVGTEGFIPPEGPGNPQADIYSLGKVLYEIATGKDRHEFPELPTLLAEGGSSTESTTGLIELNSVFLRACQTDLKKRYGSADEMRDDLLLLQGGKSVKRAQRVERQLALFTKLSIAAVIVALLTLAGFYWSKRQADEARRQALREADLRKTADEAQRKTVEALSHVKMQRAEELFATGNSQTAVAYLALVARQNRSNGAVASRLLANLASRDFALTLTTPLQHKHELTSAGFSPDGRRVVTASSDNTARVWDATTGEPVTPPLMHKKKVGHAEFSPDGRWVVTASHDGTAQVWDAESGQPVSKALRHPTDVIYATFSVDSRRVATTSWDGTARVWDAITGEAISPPLNHEAGVVFADFSPDGHRLVTASGDKTARVWDAQTGEALIPPIEHKENVRVARFSPDGSRVLTGSFDRTVRVWDAATGKPITPSLVHDDKVLDARFSPDGQRVVTCSDDRTARIWDAHTGEPIGSQMRHDWYIFSFQFSADGLRVATASGDKTARIWDAVTGKPIGPPLKHASSVVTAQFSPDGMRVLTSSTDGNARIWDAGAGGAVNLLFKHQKYAICSRFSPDGKLIVTTSQDNTAQVWDSGSGQRIGPRLQHEDRVAFAEFSPDSRRVLTASWDLTTRVWDARTGEPISPQLRNKTRLTQAHFSPDGMRVVTVSRDNMAHIWDAGSGSPIGAAIQHKGRIDTGVFSPDGKRLLTASDDRTARIWDSQTGHQIGPALEHDQGVVTAQFSPDGRYFVTASGDSARIWDGESCKLVCPPMKHDALVGSAWFSPNGHWVVTGSIDKTARVWDAKTGQPITPPLQHDDDVWHAQFSPDSQRVVTGSFDKTARVWDARTGLPISPPLKHADIVYSAEFSPDGQRVVTACWDGTARIWDVPTFDLPIPEWMLGLTEAIAGKRLSDDGLSEAVPIAKLTEIRKRVLERSGTDVWTRSAKWFFSDPATRTITPYSSVTMPEYVRSRIQENTLESLQEATRFSPTNGLAYARLALRVLEQDPERDPRRVGEAEFLSRYAVGLSPNDSDVLRIRDDIKAKAGDQQNGNPKPNQ